MMKFALVLLLALSNTQFAVASEDEHEEEHPCACEADELDFKIDCSDQDTMLTSLGNLKTMGCSTDCATNDKCEKDFYVVQAHHDYCDQEDIPDKIKDDFHDYDTVCTHCMILRKPTAGSPDCPKANCDDQSGNQAYDALLADGCLSDCSSDKCRDSFFMLRSVHDMCDHDVLSRTAEEGLHDFENACREQTCNPTEGEGQDQLVCKEDDHDSHGDSHDSHGDSHDSHSEESGAATAAATGAALAVGSMLMFV